MVSVDVKHHVYLLTDKIDAGKTGLNRLSRQNGTQALSERLRNSGERGINNYAQFIEQVPGSKHRSVGEKGMPLT